MSWIAANGGVDGGGYVVVRYAATVPSASDDVVSIYFTLDGTLPSTLSEPFIDKITLPTDGKIVTVSVVGYTFDGEAFIPTTVLSKTYSTDQSSGCSTEKRHPS